MISNLQDAKSHYQREFCNYNDGEELKLKLCGIDVLEKAQAGGIEFRYYLRSRLSDHATIRVNSIETDRYGRTVAEIFLGETFINAEIVREGYAWHYQRYRVSGVGVNKETFPHIDNLVSILWRLLLV